MKNSKKIIITGGGTGGHIFPAIEIALALKQHDASIDFLFVGSLGKIEMKKVPNYGFKIIGLWIQGIHRKSLLKNILFPIKLLISLIHSLIIILIYKPNVVIGTGGYASGPVIFIASILKIPTYIQEQNSVPGITNQILSKRANKIFVAYDKMDVFFEKNKIIVTGNPVRKSLSNKNITLHKSRSFFKLKSELFTILVVGGSLGAKPINNVILELLKMKKVDLLPKKRLQLIWQTGPDHYSEILNKLNTEIDVASSMFCNISVHEFIDAMDLAYKAADVVISRAGAIAIAEICYLKKASILIPSPFVADDHQKKNAQYLMNQNASIVINNDGLVDGNRLIKEIQNLQDNLNLISELGTNAHNLFLYNSSDLISRFIINQHFNDDQ